MKKNNKTLTLTLTLILTLTLGFVSNLKAQFFNRRQVITSLGNQFIDNWDNINKIVYSKHKENGKLIIAMHVIGEGEDSTNAPVIEIDFEKEYNGNSIFAYSFNCHENALKNAKNIFKDFKRDNKSIQSLDKNVTFGYQFYEDLPEEHIFIFNKMIDAAEKLVNLGCKPQFI